MREATHWIAECYQKINKAQKSAFVAVFCSSFLAHGFMYFNKLSNHDDIGQLFQLGGTFVFGRWFLGILGKIWSEVTWNVSLPLWNGMVSTFFIAISALLVVRILEIRNSLRATFVGALMMVFPVVVSTYSFMFTAPYYFFALLLIILAVFLQEVELRGKIVAFIASIASIACIAFSLGIYQAYLSVLLCLFLLVVFIHLNQEETCMKDIVRLVGRYVLVIGLGVLAYLVGNAFFLRLLGLEMSTYQGINGILKWNILQVLSAAVQTYRSFFEAGYEGIHPTLWMKGAVWVGLLCDAILIGILVLEKHGNEKIENNIRRVMMLVLACVFPLGVNAIMLMTGHENTYMHLVMQYSLVFVWIVPLVLLEQCEKTEQKTGRGRILSGVRFLLTILIGLQIILYIHLDNTAYLKAFFVQEQSTAYFNRLVTKIEITPGYRDEYPVVYLGSREKFSKSMTRMEELEEMSLTGFNGDLLYLVNDYTWEIYIARYCGYAPERVLEPETVEDWEEIDDMPCYPDEGSIAIIRGIVVVKFAESKTIE